MTSVLSRVWLGSFYPWTIQYKETSSWSACIICLDIRVYYIQYVLIQYVHVFNLQVRKFAQDVHYHVGDVDEARDALLFMIISYIFILLGCPIFW